LTTAGDPHGENDFNDFWILDDGNLKFQKSSVQNLKTKVSHFQSTMGKQSFLLLWTQSSISLHSKAALLLEYIEEDYIEEE
jgi:hypothetical protein